MTRLLLLWSLAIGRWSFAPGPAMTPELSSSGVPQGVVDELASLYRQSAERLREIVLHPPGRTESARQFQSARAAAQLRQIDEVLARLKVQADAWIGRHVPQAMADGVARAERQARDAGVRLDATPVQGRFDLVDPQTVAVFARDIHADLVGSRHAPGAAESMAAMARRVLRETRQQDLDERDIDRILAVGVIEGRPAETIRRLRAALQAVAGDRVTVIDKNGRPIQFDVGQYAELVARTKTRQATTVARHERLEKLGLDLVSIVGRVSRYFCTGYLGRVFSLSGRSDRYPALASLPSGGPPFHPNCSKSTRPWVESMASDEQKQDATGVADSDQLLHVDAATAQRRYQDLQIEQQVKAPGAYGARRTNMPVPARGT